MNTLFWITNKIIIRFLFFFLCLILLDIVNGVSTNAAIAGWAGGGWWSGCWRSFLIAPQLEYSWAAITNQPVVTITWATTPCWPRVVNIYNNWIFINSWSVSWASTDTGSFYFDVTLNEWANLITANEVSGTGLSVDSNTISITKDTTPPIISITSHSDNDYVTGSQLYLSWVFSDVIWLQQLVIYNESSKKSAGIASWLWGCTSSIPSIWGDSSYKSIFYNVSCYHSTWTWVIFGGTPLNLAGWINVIRYTWYDTVSNTTIWTINILRRVVSSGLSNTLSWTNTAKIEFYNDYESEGIVLYWTSSGNLNLSWTTNCVPTSNVVSSIWLPPESRCSINLNWLNSDTTYYYQGYWSFSWVIWESTPIKSFKTPAIISRTSSWEINATWSAYISGLTATWILFTETGTLRLSNNEWLWNTNVLLSLSGLTISSSWTWDGIFYAPVVTNDTAKWVESWYSFTGNVYQIGNPSVELTLSGQSATINLFVGTHLNGQTLKVYRSTNSWATYAVLTTCLVSSWICSFTSNQFSLFTVAVATVIPPVVVNNGGGGGGGGGWSMPPAISSSTWTTGSGLMNTISVNKTTSDSAIETITLNSAKFRKSKIIQLKTAFTKWTNITVFRTLPNWRMIKVWTTKVLRNGNIRYAVKSPWTYKFTQK